MTELSATNPNRWEKAQQYERKWWADRATSLELGFYKHFARDLLELTAPFLRLNKKSAVLEIGSGAAGIITFLKDAGARHAVDPLEDFYSSVKEYGDFRDPHVIYNKGKGEELPYEAEMFDLVIMDNVLDHCEDMQRVLAEGVRVLKPGGIFYLRNNTYHLWGKIVRRIIERFEIDQGHPHTVTKRSLRKQFNRLGLEILIFERGGYYKTWLKELKTLKKMELLKALTFATRDRTLFVLKKRFF